MGSIASLLVRPGVVAVGETGMDLYHDRVPVERQEELFRAHIRMAAAFGLTLVVHSRDAEEKVLQVLGDGPGVPVVMHCYTGPSKTAAAAAEKGFYVGFAGPLTYRGNQRLRELAASLPPDRILAETDSPYLSPEPVRGRRNEPANLVYIVETLSEAAGRDPGDISAQLMQNSLRAFQLGEHRRTDLIYSLYGNIYVNMTGQCTNSCRFCIRDRTDGLGGYYLRHDAEPEESRLREIVSLLPEGSGRKLVFCGYGEPTMRPALLFDLAVSAYRKGYRVRLNTNGTCLLWLSRERTADLLGQFGTVSISLNASSREEYDRLCRPGSPEAWDSLMAFIRMAAEISSPVLTAVRYPGVDMDAVGALAGSLGIPFRIRG
ncbi:MAG: hypothetical protein AVO35_00560 [Candidatus Aegiribacteria sp. MLS_C]|nr:MAG: hypothetical protein AVO35_00560 [Candidatus Aegiribacteria sp. MLS_C]